MTRGTRGIVDEPTTDRKPPPAPSSVRSASRLWRHISISALQPSQGSEFEEGCSHELAQNPYASEEQGGTFNAGFAQRHPARMPIQQYNPMPASKPTALVMADRMTLLSSLQFRSDVYHAMESRGKPGFNCKIFSIWNTTSMAPSWQLHRIGWSLKSTLNIQQLKCIRRWGIVYHPLASFAIEQIPGISGDYHRREMIIERCSIPIHSVFSTVDAAIDSSKVNWIRDLSSAEVASIDGD